MPEFITGPVQVKENDLAAAVLHPRIALQPKTGASEPAKAAQRDEGEGGLYRKPGGT